MNLLRITQFKDGEQSSFIVEDSAATRRKVLHWLHKAVGVPSGIDGSRTVDALRIERTTESIEALVKAADQELAALDEGDVVTATAPV